MRTARSRSSGGYLLDEPPDMTPSFPRTGVSGHAGAVHSDQSGATYPIAWEIEIERIGLTLRGAALMANQELRLSRTYWEGAVALEGRYQGMPISGRGYVEMTGYVQRLS
ncbi:lipocalin family protein [Mycobacterium tuberculosis]